MIRWITLKQILISLLGGILFLTACGQVSPTNIPATAIPGTEPSTIPIATSSALPSRTPRERANEPTITPGPPTPLPTIPTFTPTFDASTILTVTPAPKAECPTSVPYPEKDFDLIKFRENGNYQSPEEAVLALLNDYGPEILVNYEKNLGTNSETIAFQDFTNDGVPELALRLNC